MLALPPEDRSLSPHTGWTRAHWEAVADQLLAAVDPYRTPDGAQVILPGRESWSHCDGLEGFARTFLLAAFRVAGGGPVELLEPYRRGLAAGPRVWQPVTDRSQPMVEAASIAVGLWLTREHLWDTLDAPVRAQAEEWLSGAVRHEPVDNNWWLFTVMVGAFLGDREAVERGLARIEPWYVGDGWYSDGPGRRFDHYNGWAMHLYPALLSLLAKRDPGAYGPRLREFLRSYALTFDRRGGMLYHGRSVTYRFASVSPLFAGALLGATPLSPGQTRCVASGVLRHFLERDALSPEGLLTLGWYGPHEPSLQDYSGWASPYWASKAFLGLLLPPDHPVWTAVEEPGPAGVLAVPSTGLVVHNTGDVARLVNHGSQYQVGDPLYDRYAYSTATGPTVAGEAADNHVGIVAADGSVSPRGPLTARGAGMLGEVAWAASAAGRVESLSVVRGAVELRIHRVAPGTRLRQTGWAVTGPCRIDAAPPGLVLRPADGGPVSWLAGLHGFAEAAALEAPSGTAFGTPAVVPALTGVTETGWAVSAAVLGWEEEVALPAVEVSGHVTVVWPDGLRQAFTVTGPLPED
ncbi:DUF2264 domain-containing protein [Thermoactinospora rubra]|uniref:DUF2264 domain-containing protein n=1 Tax=Thermoactinospora rubra TaxID=1088767 RepID=UPI000A1095FC|nr:DUF2264 domain-containing protein [Thermoactinospora rubra]